MPAFATRVSEGIVRDRIEIADISVSGLRLMLSDPAPPPELELELSLANAKPLRLNVFQRWRANGIVGFEFVGPNPEIVAAVGRYVAELLERG